ncbi:hypothetical protein Taro_004005 [Colocasia esculenta]|uniref:Uncharacterized protein n=1 Tax=Colocasia esculenta TaxID=4460 RepID=A0A843TQF5_COLES|nr:hypothetical protein [Colocasia esculenta]
MPQDPAGHRPCSATSMRSTQPLHHPPAAQHLCPVGALSRRFQQVPSIWGRRREQDWNFFFLAKIRCNFLNSIASSFSLSASLSLSAELASGESSSAFKALECFFLLEDSHSLSMLISWAMRDPMSFSTDILFRSLASSIAVTFGVHEDDRWILSLSKRLSLIPLVAQLTSPEGA